MVGYLDVYKRQEYRSLNDRKTKLYEDYRQAKKQMQEYGVVKKNVDRILYPSQSKMCIRDRLVNANCTLLYKNIPWQISSQKEILMTYAKKNGYLHPQFFVDDGISGTTFAEVR